MNDQQIEAEVQAKGLTAPRVTRSQIEDAIASIDIVTHTSASGQILRWAVLNMVNGYAVVGRPSVAVSPANDDAELGKKIATDNSISDAWPLLGYELKSKLAADAARLARMPHPPEGMGRYTGTKDILAKPMNRADYNAYRGWELPADEDGADDGFLVEYIDGGRANDSRHGGYISWSPADVFARAYRPLA